MTVSQLPNIAQDDLTTSFPRNLASPSLVHRAYVVTLASATPSALLSPSTSNNNANSHSAAMINSMQPKRPGTRRISSSGEAHTAPFAGAHSQQRREEHICMVSNAEGDGADADEGGKEDNVTSLEVEKKGFDAADADVERRSDGGEERQR